MSVQLILFPQNYEGQYNSIATSFTGEFVVDGSIFAFINSSTSYDSSASSPLLDALTNEPPTIFNSWYRYRSTILGTPFLPAETSGNLVIESAATQTQAGVYQRLSALIVGTTYEMVIDLAQTSPTGFLFIHIYNGTTLISFAANSPNNSQSTFSWTAATANDTIVISYANFVNESISISKISVKPQGFIPSTIYTDLEDGQVICDLYEDEDIPLSLSVDDFKNVAEKVQSYSKAFNLPATKRNNLIFDNIFEITRTDTGLNFNPYKKTKAILKQDGFLLFEGYLRMIDISDKFGEISYNVNLYSEVVALSDLLSDKTFADIDYLELDHNYIEDEIKNSWNSTGTGITYIYPNTSGFRNDNTTVKYPFVDWNHQFSLSGTQYVFSSQTDIFRPFINIKYLIDRIFEDIPFSYESEFFNTTDFQNLYMDFNWSSDDIPVASNPAGIAVNASNTPSPASFAGTTFTPLQIVDIQSSIFPATPDSWNHTTHILTNNVLNQAFTINYSFKVRNTDTVNRTVELQWVIAGVVVDYSGPITLSPNQAFTFTGIFTTPPLAIGETVQALFKASAAGVIQQEQATVSWYFTISTFVNMLTSLRGDLGQFDFLKGLLTMFNLVTLPDEDNPGNIKIEPYKDVFVSSNDPLNPNFFDNTSVQLDWTDKIDVSEMKLVPLTELNRTTIFKFVEDDDDYAFNFYKNSTKHLYGSRKFPLTPDDRFNILSGEKEIVAEPFAATVIKPLDDLSPDFITPAVYSYNIEDDTSEGFENSPRIMFNNGLKTIPSYTYGAPDPAGSTAFQNESDYLQFSHLTAVPPSTSSRDFHFGECQLVEPVGYPTNNNLFNLYWLPYYAELYNPDTRIMTIKVNLSPSDINTFKFNDTIFIKNRTFRVNKIDYKPNDLATVEFILIP